MDTGRMSIESLQRSYRHLLMAWFAIVVLVSVLWWWLANTPPAVRAPMVEFTSDRHAADIAVCPGDTIPYAISLQVNQPGVYAIDVSVWRLTPPATVIFSEARRFVATQAATYTLERQWTVPATYFDPTTNDRVAWRPGRYERRHGITTVSREAVPSFAIIPFAIKEDCLPLEPTL